MLKREKLSRQSISYLLLHTFSITFLCLMILIDFLISTDLKILKYSFQISALSLFIIIEIVLFSVRGRFKNAEPEYKEEYSFEYLLFEIAILFNISSIILIFSQYISNFVDNIIYVIMISFVVFYGLSVYIKPYFGVK
ncbi:hypothetical protein [Haloplasma contractile]|uniref:Uncharacterized protein n=1 Tax=Haloplasma contractile SSD-17B TaxID=1033810 RepID=F7Q0F9_9MOLU|nr:hypothetical protein [Haloplasma contractile]ERJ12695.1 hypothetical protein HLPCO_001035 [Haloplasma contractile SSD-17B]